MSKSSQQLFFEALEERLPDEFSLNCDGAWSNTGILRIYRTGTFKPVLALHYQFNGTYASFSVPEERNAPGMPQIGDRENGKSFPYVTFDELEDRVLRAIFDVIYTPQGATA